MGTTVAVQGFGNVGSTAAMLLEREGCRIIAISDRTGGVHNPQGVDIAAAIEYVRRNRDLDGFRRRRSDHERRAAHAGRRRAAAGRDGERDHVARTPQKMRAKIICEGANGPTTAAADAILDEKGIFVIPDILANAGGVTVSYFEWVQDRGGYFWTEETVN